MRKICELKTINTNLPKIKSIVNEQFQQLKIGIRGERGFYFYFFEIVRI